MASKYGNEDERYNDRESYRGDRSDERRFRGQHYGGADERERGWELGRGDSSRYGTGWPEDYERGTSSRYYTGDEQGRGYAGGRDLGRSYTPSFDRDWGDESGSRGEFRRPYGDSHNRSRLGRYSERDFELTNRPPDYGRDFQEERHRTYRGEGLAGKRDWLDRVSDELGSWFGDKDAEHRRQIDKMRDASHRGKGPKGYRRSDERIKEDVNDRLTDYPYLDASEIVVGVQDREVTLQGTVNDRTDKRIAEAIAESVSGVANVQNNLRVEQEQVSTAGLETPETRSATAR
jgi:osmotically-inducible protein OsmY